MLEILVALDETFDEKTNTFGKTRAVRVFLEHSLVSASKWESIWEKPFLGKGELTPEQLISYVEMMILNVDIPPEAFQKLLENHLEQIKNYIGAEMTATKIAAQPGTPGYREVITTEVIYYWMVSMGIPFECQNWHLNRLLTLIRVINAKNTKPKKMTMEQRRALNNQRRAQYQSKG